MWGKICSRRGDEKGAKRERGGGGEELASPLSTCILHQQTALPTQKNMFVPEREEKKGGNSYILFGIRGSRNSQTPKKYIYERKKEKKKKKETKEEKKEDQETRRCRRACSHGVFTNPFR